MVLFHVYKAIEWTLTVTIKFFILCSFRISITNISISRKKNVNVLCSFKFQLFHSDWMYNWHVYLLKNILSVITIFYKKKNTKCIQYYLMYLDKIFQWQQYTILYFSSIQFLVVLLNGEFFYDIPKEKSMVITLYISIHLKQL
jgi:hypothetical protein